MHALVQIVTAVCLHFEECGFTFFYPSLSFLDLFCNIVAIINTRIHTLLPSLLSFSPFLGDLIVLLNHRRKSKQRKNGRKMEKKKGGKGEKSMLCAYVGEGEKPSDKQKIPSLIFFPRIIQPFISLHPTISCSLALFF